MKKHDWVRKHWGPANECEICDGRFSTTYEWANISRQYKRDREDWMKMCRSCHLLYDRRMLTIDELRDLRGDEPSAEYPLGGLVEPYDIARDRELTD
jgi:hypothetical protein